MITPEQEKKILEVLGHTEDQSQAGTMTTSGFSKSPQNYGSVKKLGTISILKKTEVTNKELIHSFKHKRQSEKLLMANSPYDPFDHTFIEPKAASPEKLDLHLTKITNSENVNITLGPISTPNGNPPVILKKKKTVLFSNVP